MNRSYKSLMVAILSGCDVPEWPTSRGLFTSEPGFAEKTDHPDVLNQRCMVRLLMQENPMRTAIVLDDNLIATAQEYTGLMVKNAHMREALKALIERAASRRSAELGGASPDVAYTRRRRTKGK